MSEFEEEYEAKGVEFLAVNAYEDREAARAWIRDSGLRYRWLWADQGALDALGVKMVPTQILLDREGRVAWVSGLMSLGRGADAIREALDGLVE